MNCTECKETRSKLYEADLVAAYLERANRRLFIALLIMIVLFVGTNLCWIYYESQFEEVTTQTVEQEAENGENHFIGGDYIGETENNDN